jgi:hypothetical protein
MPNVRFVAIFSGKGKYMEEARNWRDVLRQIIRDTKEKQRLVDELNVTPITLTRWVNGESDPRPQNLRQLINALPQHQEQIQKLVKEEKEFSDFLDSIQYESVKAISTFRIRIVEEPLTPRNLTSILSAITDLSTQCWLLGKGRLADLIAYTQTHDVRFIEETHLSFTKITYNSPFDASFKIDLSASNIAQAITTSIDGVVQAKQRLEKAEMENKKLAQEIEKARQKSDQENKTALFEQERLALAIEKERLEILEKRLDVQKKGIEYALEIANKTVTVLYPTADEQTKALLMQTLLPTLLQLQNGKGLELVLPAPQGDEKAVEPEQK